MAISQTYVKPSALSTATKVAFRQSLGIDSLLNPQQIKNSVNPDFVIKKRGTVYSAFPISDSISSFTGTNFNTVLDSCFTLLNNQFDFSGYQGLLVIGPGKYDSLTFITIPCPMTLSGSGMFQTILQAKDSLDIDLTGTYQGFVHCSGIDGFTIQNIQLDGNGFNQSKINYGNMLPDTAKLNGVSNYLSGTTSDSVLIDNCYIHDFPQDGASIGLGSGHIIRNSFFIDNFWNGPTFVTNSENSIVENCYVAGSGDVAISHVQQKQHCQK